MRRSSIMVGALLLALAACGGGDQVGDADGDTASGTASSGAGETTTPEATTTTAASESTASSGATVTVGETTYTYAVVDDGGSCNPDFFGSVRAILTRVDDAGNPLELEGAPGISDGVTIAVNAAGEGVIGGPRWSAGDDGDDASSIDSVEVTDLGASGTATFVVADTDEVVAGAFEVTCAEE